MFSQYMRPENSLFHELQRIQNEVDSLFRSGTGRANIRTVKAGSFPAVNVDSTPEAAYVTLFAPGLDTDSLDVSIQRNVLSVSGRRVSDEKESGERSGYHLRERFQGSFRRAISLPEDVDPDRVEATYKNGVLFLKVGKREAAKPRQIAINS